MAKASKNACVNAPYLENDHGEPPSLFKTIPVSETVLGANVLIIKETGICSPFEIRLLTSPWYDNESEFTNF